MSIIDSEIYDPCFEKDLHIGLLCVQELTKDRAYSGHCNLDAEQH